MEEYTENEEEDNMELQSEDVQEDRPETRIETKQPPDEGRKRKRNAKET